MGPDPKTILAAVAVMAIAAPASQAANTRIEYRYPDRPDVVYSSDGQVRRVTEDRPMAFSKFESAISQTDAQRMMNDFGYSSELPARVPARQTAQSSPPLFEPMPLPPAEPVEQSWQSAAPSYSASDYQAPAYTPAPAYNAMTYVIQVGAFSSYANAARMMERVSVYDDADIVEGRKNGKPLYRVYLGGWSIRNEAQSTLNVLKSYGIDGFVTKAS